MPAERGKDAAERFAAVVDRGRPPRNIGSDTDLARELEIVAKLRSQDRTYASHADAMAMLRSDTAAYAPRPDERARAKQRLMALLAEPGSVGERRGATTVGPVVASDSERRAARSTEPEPGSDADVQLAPVTPLASRAAHRTGRHNRMSRPAGRARTTTGTRRQGLARRAGLVGSAALLVMVAFTGAGVFASRDALPGQTLYPLKRAAEAAGLAMTFDDEARAQRNLELAAIRLSEVEQLVASRGTAGVDPQLLRAAMLEFDTATNEGSRTLLSDQAGAGNGTLQAWAATQSARLSALRSALPVPAVPAADTSIALLDRLLGRSPELDSRTPAADPSADLDTATSSPARRGSETARNPGGPAATGQTEESGLPPISPDSGPLGSDPAVEPAQPETPAETEKQDSARLPLPLPGAPITLPPLLPGMPPLTIG